MNPALPKLKQVKFISKLAYFVGSDYLSFVICLSFMFSLNFLVLKMNDFCMFFGNGCNGSSFSG